MGNRLGEQTITQMGPSLTGWHGTLKSSVFEWGRSTPSDTISRVYLGPCRTGHWPWSEDLWPLPHCRRTFVICLWVHWHGLNFWYLFYLCINFRFYQISISKSKVHAYLPHAPFFGPVCSCPCDTICLVQMHGWHSMLDTVAFVTQWDSIIWRDRCTRFTFWSSSGHWYLSN